MSESRYSVGIDLGTTHCVVAYVDDSRVTDDQDTTRSKLGGQFAESLDRSIAENESRSALRVKGLHIATVGMDRGDVEG